MLDYEYKKQQEAREKLRVAREPRNWLLTIICFILAGTVVWGIFGALKYIGHDGLTIFTLIIPAAIICLVLLIAAVRGKKSIIKEAFEAVMYIIIFWR